MKLPFISRSRHERELKLLQEAYRSSTTDLREKLQDLITTFVNLKWYRNQDMQYIDVRYVFSPLENEYLSPYQKKELMWHISQNICNKIEKAEQLALSKNEKSK